MMVSHRVEGHAECARSVPSNVPAPSAGGQVWGGRLVSRSRPQPVIHQYLRRRPLAPSDGIAWSRCPLDLHDTSVTCREGPSLDACPDRLYKYFAPGRSDVFEDWFVRF